MPGEPQPAGRHVLLVDDEPAFLDEMALYLRRRGWTVTNCATPCEVMVQLDLHAGITVVATDVRLGSLYGFELAGRIQRERQGHRAVAVVVMTGHGDLTKRERMDQSPGLPVLRKPLNLPVFLAALDAALARATRERAAEG